MSSEERRQTEEKREKARKILYREPEIEELQEEFELSEDARSAASLIYRILVGLGKGLSDSQKRSFSALAIRIAAERVDDNRPRKKDLADAVDVSHRTLSRRFKEINEDEECKKVLDYIEDKIRQWSKRKEQRLQEIL